ncbi:MAG TPA: hypothetical protein VJ913_04830 [Actinomycetota bacterium]|nr:hypothetical protein [Actinomycetota bacterium]
MLERHERDLAMEPVAWTAITLLAATLVGSFYVGNRRSPGRAYRLH